MAHIRSECNSFGDAFRLAADPHPRCRRLAAILCFQPVLAATIWFHGTRTAPTANANKRGWEQTLATLWFKSRPLYGSSDRSAIGPRRHILPSWPIVSLWLAKCKIASRERVSYGECMARLISTTVRLDEEDLRALKRARAAGLSASELIRKGLRVVASRYYSGRRPPSTLLFESSNSKLGDESELFRDIDE